MCTSGDSSLTCPSLETRMNNPTLEPGGSVLIFQIAASVLREQEFQQFAALAQLVRVELILVSVDVFSVWVCLEQPLSQPSFAFK
jgi:hypothetical protein